MVRRPGRAGGVRVPDAGAEADRADAGREGLVRAVGVRGAQHLVPGGEVRVGPGQLDGVGAGVARRSVAVRAGRGTDQTPAEAEVTLTLSKAPVPVSA